MNKFENTLLWQKTLATQLDPDPDADTRATLRNALENFRERAKVLAGEIANSLPDFTVHDITHIDALWEMAEIVAGKEFSITPTEAFVLGGAFLIHDLGMGLAAFPNGLDELRQEQLWQDSVAALLRYKLGRPPKIDEINNPDSETQKQATGIVLRELHAKQAERLALVSWKESNKAGATEYHLIEDVFLRQTYGPIIGKIAHSHWWPVERLAQDLPLSGVPGGYPASWTVDPIKLACLLRTADASHLDERRAPGFLRALRKPSGVANEHWAFQEKLYQPRLEADRLVYTSKSAFAANEAQAWWLCFDALRVVDNELRQVDALLADMRKPQLAARGVSYVEEPKRLTKLIATSSWEPVDAKIKVGDVAKLVGNLGGEQLYGRNVLVPLRELIQNASDAVRARRLLERQAENWGDIYIRHGKDDTGHWIEVEDTGVGMSADVLTGPFLDFGTSFWGTSMMHAELPGLQSKGFSSTGRYGIGFFSVFMWGARVQIVTRRYEKAREDTLILEFQEGLASRPLLRKALPDEFVKDGGTRIRIWLKDPEVFEGMLSFQTTGKPLTLEQRCAWLCPTLDVNLHVESKGKVKKVVAASDWITMSGTDLVKRILVHSDALKQPKIESVYKSLVTNLRVLRNSSGEVVGRACVVGREALRVYLAEEGKLSWFTQVNTGLVTIGGFRSSRLEGFL